MVKPLIAFTEGGKRASLEEIICILEAEQTAGRARAHLSSGGGLLRQDSGETPDNKNQIFVAQIKRDAARKAVTFLVNRGDPNAPSPAFFDMVSDGKVRVEDPKPPEALGWSAHLTIATDANGGLHRACFETRQGLSSSLVLAMFDHVIERALASNPVYVFETFRMEKGRRIVDRKRYRPVLDVARVPSERLVEDLERGELSTITLTQQGADDYGGPGAKGHILRQERKLVLHTKRADPDDMKALVSDIMTFAKTKAYQKVTFHLDKLPGGMTNQPTIDVAASDALEVLYVRAQRLTGFSNFLENAYETVNSEIESKMIELLSNNDLW